MKKADDRQPRPLAPDELRQKIVAFQHSRVILTGFELGVFTVLGDGGKTSAQVASEIGADPRATDRLLNALCAIGICEKTKDVFSNGAAAASLLVKGKPEFMAELFHTNNLWDTWNTMTEAVRKGGPARSRPINDRGEAWLKNFIGAMHARAYRNAPEVIRLLDLSNVSRVIDVGGGSGAYAMAFVRAQSDIRVTVFDLPNVAPLTRDYVKKEGLSDRIDTVIGDYLRDDLGNGFDVGFLSAIVHSNSVDENKKLIKKVFLALKPKGQIVVQEFIVDENRTSPPMAAIFALNMLVSTDAGDTFTESEVRSWLEEAGFGDVARKDTPFGTTLIVGRKA